MKTYEFGCCCCCLTLRAIQFKCIYNSCWFYGRPGRDQNVVHHMPLHLHVFNDLVLPIFPSRFYFMGACQVCQAGNVLLIESSESASGFQEFA